MIKVIMIFKLDVIWCRNIVLVGKNEHEMRFPFDL